MSRSFNGSEGMLAAATVCVQITFEGHPPKVELNQQQLTDHSQDTPKQLIRDVTSLLARSNSLVLVFDAEKHCLVTAVSLLIYDAAEQK